MTPTGHRIIELFIESLDSINPKSNKRVIPERDAKILLKLYDFENNHYLDFKGIAEEFKLSKERIRQIHVKSLKRLRIASRNFNDDRIACVKLHYLLINAIGPEIGEEKINKLISLWENNLPDISGKIFVNLFSQFVYQKGEEIYDISKIYRMWKKTKLKEERNVYKQLRQYESGLIDQENLIKNTIWFEKKTKWDNVNFNELTPKRKVNKNSKYKSGVIFSQKCQREVQYESGLELNFILALDNMPMVKFFSEQPTTIEYTRYGRKYKYTPDFVIFLDNNEAIIAEIKDFSGMADNRVQRNMEALIEYCMNYGFGLILTDGKYTLNKLLGKRYNVEFEKELLLKLDENGGRTIFLKEFKIIQAKYNAQWSELLTIVLKNNLGFYPFPFKLNRRNNYKLFRDTMKLNNNNLSI